MEDKTSLTTGRIEQNRRKYEKFASHGQEIEHNVSEDLRHRGERADGPLQAKLRLRLSQERVFSNYSIILG